jgi:aspartyl-tRNA(Asn)/glutamyl-tRNA(Gln) amidotransferase subunit B
LADYFEAVVKTSGCEAKLCANWVVGDLSAALNKADLDISDSPVSAEQLAGLLSRINDGTISGKIAKQIFEALWQQEGVSADAIIDAKGLRQISDTGAIAAIIDKIIADNPGQVEQYRSGKDKVFGFFVGQVMKEMQGKANPAEVNKMLVEKLKA